MQLLVPSSHKSLSGPSQGAPTPGSSDPSTLAGSQSSSNPLHMSRSSPVASLHVSTPPEQMLTPSSHKSLSGPSQGAPIAGSSSPSLLAGSQSSSAPLQMSRSSSPVPALSHTKEPAVQASYTSSVHRSLSPPSQAVPIAGSSDPSALAGSQSLSAPSHTSRVSPDTSEHTSEPAGQLKVPSSHRSLSGPSQT